MLTFLAPVPLALALVQAPAVGSGRAVDTITLTRVFAETVVMTLPRRGRPGGLLDASAAMVKKACARDYVARSLGEANVDGRPAVFAVIGCGRAPASAPAGLKQGDSEVAMHAVITGREDVYMITRARRGPGINATAYPRQTLKPWQAFVNSIRICDMNTPPAECVSRMSR